MKLSDIKSVDGERLMVEKTNGVCVCDCIPCKTDSCDNCNLSGHDLCDKYKNGDLCHERCCCDDTQNIFVDQQSLRHVGIEVDKEKLALAIHKIIFNKEMEENTLIRNLEIYGMADSLISQKDKWSRIVYVKE